MNGEGYVDVTFPSSPYPTGGTSFSGSLNSSSVTSTAPAFEIVPLASTPNQQLPTLDTSQAPLQIATGEYRYWLTGVTPAMESSGTDALTDDNFEFIQGTVSYSDSQGNVIFNQYGVDTSTTNANPTAQPEYPSAISLVHGAYVDVRVYPSVGGQLNVNNLSALVNLNPPAVQVTGPSGSLSLTATPPTLLADGMTVRYYLPADATLPGGAYTVTVLPNKFGDSLSTTPNNVGGTYSFSVVNVTAQVVGPVVTTTTGGANPSTDVGAANAAKFTDPSGYTEAGQTLPYIDIGYNPAPGTTLDYDSILGSVNSSNTRVFPTTVPFTVEFTPAGSSTYETLTIDPEPVPIIVTPSFGSFQGNATNGQTVTFAAAASSTQASMTLSSGTWTGLGFQAGDQIQVAGSQHNNGSYVIATISSDGTVLYLTSSASLTSEMNASDVSVSTVSAMAVTGTLDSNLPDDTTLQNNQVEEFRYLIIGTNGGTNGFTYSPGTLTVNFTGPGASDWKDSQGDPGQASGTPPPTFLIQGPTAAVTNPGAGSSIDVSALIIATRSRSRCRSLPTCQRATRLILRRSRRSRRNSH